MPSQAASPAPPAAVEPAAAVQEHTAVRAIQTNLAYLYSPGTASERPGRLRTRAALRVVRAVGVFLFWRAVRYARYVAVGAAVTALSATALGSVVSGVAWIAAPPSILAAVCAGTVWMGGRWALRFAYRRVAKVKVVSGTGADAGRASRAVDAVEGRAGGRRKLAF